MATTTVPITDHLQHSNHDIQISHDTTIVSIINDKSLLLVPEEDENDVVTIAQFPSANPPVAPFTPSPNPLSISILNGKRKRLKPDKYKPPSINKEKRKIVTPKQKVKRDTSTSLSSRNNKNVSNQIHHDPAQISATMIKAGEIQASLGNKYPTFCKIMVRSHVTSCFWMGLPLPFCKSFLPLQESPIVVIDESGVEYIVKYIAYRFGLSAGWKTFAIGHKLREGDVLIFQLVGPCKFKIYIVKTNTPNVGDSAIRLLKDVEHKEDITPEFSKIVDSTQEIRKAEYKLNGRKRKTNSKSKGYKSTETKSNGSKPTDTKLTMVRKRFAKPNLLIEELKTFEHFHIIVNKCCIDSELSEEIRLDYYNLCVAKNEILHDGIRDGVYYKLVAGMIGETVNIANLIKNCELTIKKEQFDVWDSSLKSFEIMGMKVGFLRNRIRALATLMFETEEAKRRVEAKEEKKTECTRNQEFRSKSCRII